MLLMRIKIMVDAYQHHPAGAVAKILATPFVIMTLIFLVIRDFVEFVWNIRFLMVVAALLVAIITTGCMTPRQLVNDTRCIYDLKTCDPEQYEEDNGYEWVEGGAYYGGYYSGNTVITLEPSYEQEIRNWKADADRGQMLLEQGRQTWIMQQQLEEMKKD